MNVLIVDNSAAIRKILQRVIRHAEVPIGEAFEAADGVEALNQMRSQKVGLVLSDINMPNMDGIQLLTEIKRNPEWKDTPVIMITTEGSQAKVMEAINLGAVGYLRKPFTAEQIKEKLTALV